jgi:hypothetical protein
MGGYTVLVLFYGLLGNQGVLVVSQSDHRDWFQDTLPAVVKPQCPAVELQNLHETTQNASAQVSDVGRLYGGLRDNAERSSLAFARRLCALPAGDIAHDALIAESPTVCALSDR